MQYYHKQRLLKLAEFLTILNPAKFALNHWVCKTVQLYNPYLDDVDVAKLNTDTLYDCDTVGCAVGWSCLISSFRKAGLTLKKGKPRYKNKHSWSAIKLFFGLDKKQVAWLFADANYEEDTLPIEVSDRIKQFVKDNGQIEANRTVDTSTVW